jgi:hypothetical protein
METSLDVRKERKENERKMIMPTTDELVETRVDRRRGCGWRKEGGLYLVSDQAVGSCGKLPIQLGTCPCCGNGIRPSRAWQWVDGDALAAPYTCPKEKEGGCKVCPLSNHNHIGRAGLIWVGGVFYKKPEDFNRESIEQGISRRISAIPRGFVVGKTWVMVAHREAIAEKCKECKGNGGTFGNPKCEPCDSTGIVRNAGIFGVYLPKAIEYVVKGDETVEELQSMRNRGITPVKVERNREDVLLEEAERKKAADEKAKLERERAEAKAAKEKEKAERAAARAAKKNGEPKVTEAPNDGTVELKAPEGEVEVETKEDGQVFKTKIKG